MPTFPKTENDIQVFGQLLVQGLRELQSELPSPPMGVDDLKTKLDTYRTALEATILTEGAFREQHGVKDQALQELVSGMRADIKYAEAMLRGKPDREKKLVKLGWGPRRALSTLEAPGEVREIAIEKQGDTWLTLTWTAPRSGGAPAFYRIQRKKDGAAWEDVGTTTDIEYMASNQPRGVEFTFQVMAVNRAGTGNPSGTVSAVL
ncbi:MAG: fibronectin type III domain-containing protein [Gemmatimonadetes bacterium]|nr:fibronectin type III domain-containing protein [Gemmatimonadota bacterium]